MPARSFRLAAAATVVAVVGAGVLVAAIRSVTALGSDAAAIVPGVLGLLLLLPASMVLGAIGTGSLVAAAPARAGRLGMLLVVIAALSLAAGAFVGSGFPTTGATIRGESLIRAIAMTGLTSLTAVALSGALVAAIVAARLRVAALRPG